MFILPIIVFVLFLLLQYVNKKNVVEAVIQAWLFVTFFTWTSVELLSIFDCWNFFTVLIAWSIVCLSIFVVIYRKRTWRELAILLKNNGILSVVKDHKGWVISEVVFITFVSTIALLKSQNLIDNLTHRLPKIMHWIQNESIASFATSSSRQVQLSSLTEYMNAQVYILGGNDRLINVVQICAYVCSACIIFGICRKFAVSYSLAFVASGIYLLTPIVIIETCTAQTDTVAGVYLLIFVYYILDYIRADKLKMDKSGFYSCICLASCVLFGYLSKPTVCFTMMVFFVWMCIIRIYKKDSIGVLVKYIVVGGVTALVLFAPSYVRKYQTYLAPNSLSEESMQREGQETKKYSEPNQDGVIQNLTDPSEFIMSCVQNLGANASSRCFPKVNEVITNVINKMHAKLGYEFYPREFRIFVDQAGLGETNEPSPCIMWMWIAAWGLVILRISKISKEQVMYLICVSIGIIIQSGLMGYTYYRQRYLIGAMAVLCPVFAIVISNLKVDLSVKRNIAAGIVAISCLGAVNALTYEIAYAKDGFRGEKVHQYFVNNREPEYYYDYMSRFVNENSYTQIGISGSIQYEYVFWQVIDNLERLEMVNVEDVALCKYEDRSYVPECILKESEEEITIGDTLDCHNVQYECVWVEKGGEIFYTLYLPVY